MYTRRARTWRLRGRHSCISALKERCERCRQGNRLVFVAARPWYEPRDSTRVPVFTQVADQIAAEAMHPLPSLAKTLEARTLFLPLFAGGLVFVTNTTHNKPLRLGWPQENATNERLYSSLSKLQAYKMKRGGYRTAPTFLWHFDALLCRILYVSQTHTRGNARLNASSACRAAP